MRPRNRRAATVPEATVPMKIPIVSPAPVFGKVGAGGVGVVVVVKLTGAEQVVLLIGVVWLGSVNSAVAVTVLLLPVKMWLRPTGFALGLVTVAPSPQSIETLDNTAAVLVLVALKVATVAVRVSLSTVKVKSLQV